MDREDDRTKARVTHSEVEKRRREKMNKYLFELIPYLPQNDKNVQNKKLDKISTLKLAVQHLKNLKGNSNNNNNNTATSCMLSSSEESISHQALSKDAELQSILLNENETFILAIRYDTNKITYASKSCTNIIGYELKDLIDKSFLDIIHPSDINFVKDQLVYTDLPNLSKELTPGSRRHFLCRILCNRNGNCEEYMVTNFTAILKNQIIKPSFSSSSSSSSSSTLASSSSSLAALMNTAQNQHRLLKKRFSISNNDSNMFNLEFSSSSSELLYSQSIYQQQSQVAIDLSQTIYYIVLYGHIEPKVLNIYSIEIVNRLDLDGTFLQVDPRIYLVLGYLPHELIGQKISDFINNEDFKIAREAVIKATKNKEKVNSEPYRFKHKSGEYIYVDAHLSVFENPFNNKIEYVISRFKLLSPKQHEEQNYNSSMLLTKDEFNLLHSAPSSDCNNEEPTSTAHCVTDDNS